MATATASRPNLFRQQEFARSIDRRTRTVDAFVATETPVTEFDYNREEMVPRILLASGAEWPAIGQVPLLNCHNRTSISNILGSVRDLTKEPTAVVGTLHFSSTAALEWSMVEEGHATDVSAGFQVLAETYVYDGEREIIDGRIFTGPVNVATRWKLCEVSLISIGADPGAKLREQAVWLDRVADYWEASV